MKCECDLCRSCKPYLPHPPELESIETFINAWKGAYAEAYVKYKDNVILFWYDSEIDPVVFLITETIEEIRANLTDEVMLYECIDHYMSKFEVQFPKDQQVF